MTLERAGAQGSLRYVVALGLIVVAAFFIGMMPNAAKLAYQAGANPIALLVVRTVVASVGIAAFLRARGQPLAIPAPFVGRTALAGIALLFAAGGGMGAVAYIDVSLASVLFFTYPFFVAALNHLRGQTRLGGIDVLLMVFAFLGLTLALGVRLDGLNATGVTLALVSSLGITVLVLATTDISMALGSVRANLHMTLWAGAYFGLLALAGPLSGVMEPMHFPASGMGWVWLFASAISFTLGFLSFFSAATILGATRASVLSILEPIMMILIAVLLVGEVLSHAQVIGVALVLASLLALELVSLRR